MRVLSLFDGMSCGMLALQRVGIPVEAYYASEIDKYAIQVSQKNFPEIFHIWDITKINRDFFINDRWIDLIIWWSPCQWFSFAGKQLNFDDPRSKLFFEYVRILKEMKPKYFLLENVRMKKEYQDIISENLFWVQPIEINSALVSAQNRRRLYRVGERQEDGSYKQVHIDQPKDKLIFLKDILLPETYTEFDKSYALTASYNGAVLWNSIEKSQRTMVRNKPIRVWTFWKWWQWQRVYDIDWKSVTLSAQWWWRGAKTWLYLIKDYARKLEPIECERLQNVPDNYTEWVSKTNRRKILGNWWTVDVIAHIFSFIKNPLQ